MKITKDEYHTVLDKIHLFLSSLEELGVSAATVSISTQVDGIGWSPDHFCCGDPLTGRSLAQDYIDEAENGDDGIFVYRGEPDGDGGGYSDSFGG